jgi:hypothetical protein
MGIDRNKYVGPYIECVNKIVEKVVPFISCPNTFCQQHGHTLYYPCCPHCGQKVTDIEKLENVQKINPMQVDTNEALFVIRDSWSGDSPVDADIFAPNRRGFGRSNLGDNALVEIYGTMIEIEMQNLRENYAKEITQLESLYGKENVHVKWGVAFYTS